MKPAINPPPAEETSHTKYLAACLFALEPSIESLLSAALKSGWKRDYVLLAIMAITANDGEETSSSCGSLHS